MDKSNQLCFYIFLTTTLFTDINSIDDFPLNWFDAQNHCLSQGLTIEREKSDQPYWTGVYRRLTPWINILGCYKDSIESKQDVLNITMTISSVAMCQELCYHEKIDKFAVKMNTCLCIESDIYGSRYNRLSASNCNIKCVVNTDDIYFEDWGGEGAYNIYETQGVYFNSVESCMALQCNPDDIKFIPQQCSKSFEKVCENMTLPRNGYANSWSLSMKQCRESHPSTYLLGDFDLDYPYQVCKRIPQNLQLFWVGVARQIYTTIDQGWEINVEERERFQECQLCTNNECCFKSCYDLAASSIFCETILGTSQRQETGNVTRLHGNLNDLSNHLTAKKLIALHFTIKNCDEAQLPSVKDTQQKSSASNNLALKISLPLILGIIILLSSAVGLVFYRRRGKMTKTDRTTKSEVKSVPQIQVYSELDFAQSNSSFTLEHCYQKISKGSNSLNESPYSNSEESVNDHLKVKQAQEKEGNNTYQNASTDMTGDIFRYDTIANTVNKNQE
ncbi:uncharacterized protein LOC128171646 isoform X2 [Crassostrea angulata]|nr:uncharacterized protein LOC128171646 isoform X2 [Crassostrea angulata]